MHHVCTLRKYLFCDAHTHTYTLTAHECAPQAPRADARANSAPSFARQCESRTVRNSPKSARYSIHYINQFPKIVQPTNWWFFCSQLATQLSTLYNSIHYTMHYITQFTKIVQVTNWWICLGQLATQFTTSLNTLKYFMSRTGDFFFKPARYPILYTVWLNLLYNARSLKCWLLFNITENVDFSDPSCVGRCESRTGKNAEQCALESDFT